MIRCLLIALIFLGLAGCAPQTDNTPCSTGKVIPAASLPGWRGDTQYGEVNSAWLGGFYGRWKADLFSKGVTKWDGRFDCNRFASHYQAASQIEYYLQNFHSWTPGTALAVAEVWYKQGGTSPHAIVCAYTERGRVFIEPQTGKEITLTAAEQASIYFVRM